MTLRVLGSLADIPAERWDAWVPDDNPFLRHGFLSALEDSGSVGAARGWQPAHALWQDGRGEPVAAMPGWLKSHSRGEYVFDQGWAEAAWRAGIDYYPKWLSAIPFTPITGPRLLGDASVAADLLQALTDCPELAGVSGWHINFTPPDDDALFGNDPNWLPRQDCQYHWQNPGYASFADFLAALRSDRRKKIRQERQRLAGEGLAFEWLGGSAVSDALLGDLYACYAMTYQVRGQRPYLTPTFFRLLCERLGDVVQWLCVRRDGQVIAMAMFLRGSQTLYGRYWGALEDVPLLHFETCLYRGIEYAIAHGFTRFDAGAQGEHKLVRGFSPVLTRSWHRLRHPGLHRAVGDFLQRERAAVADYRERAEVACPYRNQLN